MADTKKALTPAEIMALPDGTRVRFSCPGFDITNETRIEDVRLAVLAAALRGERVLRLVTEDGDG